MAVPVQALVQGQAVQQNGRDLEGAAASDGLRQVVADDPVPRERVVGRDCLVFGRPDERSRDSTGLGPWSMFGEPRVQARLAGVEGIEPLYVGVERLRAEHPSAGDDFARAASGTTKRRTRTGRTVQGGEKIVEERGGHAGLRLVLAHDLFGPVFCAERTKSLTGRLTRSAARALLALLSGRTRTSRRAVAAMAAPSVYGQLFGELWRPSMPRRHITAPPPPTTCPMTGSPYGVHSDRRHSSDRS